MEINYTLNDLKVAYTFDAGPNAVLFIEETNLGHFASIFHSQFAAIPADKFYKGNPIQLDDVVGDASKINNLPTDFKGHVQYVVNCRVGKGPQLV